MASKMSLDEKQFHIEGMSSAQIQQRQTLVFASRPDIHTDDWVRAVEAERDYANKAKFHEAALGIQHPTRRVEG